MLVALTLALGLDLLLTAVGTIFRVSRRTLPLGGSGVAQLGCLVALCVGVQQLLSVVAQ